MSDPKERELEMELQRELAFFREQITPVADRIELPQALSAQALLGALDAIEPDSLEDAQPFDENECALIEESNVVPFYKNKKRLYSMIGTVAACLVCVVGIVYSQSANRMTQSLENAPESSQLTSAAENETEIEVEGSSDIGSSDAGSDPASGEPSGGSSPDAGTTSSQVDNVPPAQVTSDPAQPSSAASVSQASSAQSGSGGLPTGGGRTSSTSDDSGDGGGSVSSRVASSSSSQASSAAESQADSAAGTSAQESDDSVAATAKDYTEIRDKIFALQGGHNSLFGGAYDGKDIIMEDAAEPGSSGIAAPETGGGGDASGAVESPVAKFNAATAAAPNASAYSATNVQEKGVDEADVVKTDGTYLYSYVYKNSTSMGPAIFIAEAENMAVASKIALPQAVQEFYIYDNYLITVGYEYVDSSVLPRTTIAQGTDNGLLKEIEERKSADKIIDGTYYYPPVNPTRTTVKATVYDISNRAAPRLLHTYAQDGDYTSSRMIGSTLYLVSTHYVWTDFTNPDACLSDIVPAVYSNGTARLISPDCIAIAPRIQSTTYAVASALNVSNGQADSQAILGAAEGIYMSDSNLYVHYSGYRYSLLQRTTYEETNIVKYAVNGSGLTLKQTGSVPGYVNGQFAFSESGGNLRVATTSYKDYQTQNNVYVLNPSMTVMGKLEGLAPNERIYSVRYIGNMAYVVTFRQMDPLFAIDLSNPSAPKLLGQLKIPGFSEYLHPLDSNTLLGIGQSADANGVTDGLKLSLFDVSDPLNPKETAVYNLGGSGSYSEALDNHRAVMFNESRNLFAFPASLSGSSEMRAQQGYFVFSYDKAKGFTLETMINLSETDPSNYFLTVNRGQYIGATLYVFAPDRIASFSLDTFEKQEEMALS